MRFISRRALIRLASITGLTSLVASDAPARVVLPLSLDRDKPLSDPFFICGFDDDLDDYPDDRVTQPFPPMESDPVLRLFRDGNTAPFLAHNPPVPMIRLSWGNHPVDSATTITRLVQDFFHPTLSDPVMHGESVNWMCLHGDTIREKTRHMLVRIEQAKHAVYVHRMRAGLSPEFGNRVIASPEVVAGFMIEKDFEPDPSLGYPHNDESITRVGRFHGAYIYRNPQPSTLIAPFPILNVAIGYVTDDLKLSTADFNFVTLEDFIL